jgi:hypothetical protein
MNASGTVTTRAHTKMRRDWGRERPELTDSSFGEVGLRELEICEMFALSIRLLREPLNEVHSSLSI